MKLEDKNLRVEVLSPEHVKSCTGIYIDAYGREPWCENYDVPSVEGYLRKYLNINSFLGFVLVFEDEVIGEVLGLVMPTTEKDYYRIEDFCISPKFQNRGMGCRFLEMLKVTLKEKGMDSIILNTNRKFPSFTFYRKNGFVDLKDSSTLFLELE